MNRAWDIRAWNYMVEGWATAIILGVISIWIIFKALSLDDIAKIASTDRDKKLCKDPRAFSC